MYQWSKRSLISYNTLHPDLQVIFDEVLKHFDCVLLEGFRNEEKQNEAVRNGKSDARWPNGNHNKSPSMAVDVMPYPIDWNDTRRVDHFAGFVRGLAVKLLEEGKITHKMRWGGDWRSTGDPDNNKKYGKNDLDHFELLKNEGE